MKTFIILPIFNQFLNYIYSNYQFKKKIKIKKIFFIDIISFILTLFSDYLFVNCFD